MSNRPLPPFSCTYSPQIPELLMQLKCTIALSTYQAGKVVFLSPKDNNRLIQLPRNFQKAMGIALHEDKMAIALKDNVMVLSNSKELGLHYPSKPGVYDGLYIPRASYYTGQLDIHDIDYCGKHLFAVNTSFSCLIKIDDNFSFTPVWKPPFITKLASEDRCHLNGMAAQNGRPKYVTAFNNGDTPGSWRDVVTTGGILMDVDSNEFVARDLPMPHSPRVINDELYLLLSATGEFVKMDMATGKYEVIYKIDGFVRGLAYYKDHVFIGLSRLRENSSTFAKLDIAGKALKAGIAIIHLPTGAYVGSIYYENSVDEIYDVQILPDMIRPGIMNIEKDEHKQGLSTPFATYWARPKPADS